MGAGLRLDSASMFESNLRVSGSPRLVAAICIVFGAVSLWSALVEDVPLLALGQRALATVESIERINRRSVAVRVRIDRPPGGPLRLVANIGAVDIREDAKVPVVYSLDDDGSATIFTAAHFWLPLAAKLAIGVFGLGLGVVVLRKRR